MIRVITLANGMRVSIGEYVRGVKFAKANPEMCFDYGLTTWYGVTGKDIMRQFYQGVEDRINQRGVKEREVQVA